MDKSIHAPLSYSVTDACRVSSIGRSRLYQLMKSGELRTVKLGGRRLIPADALRELVTVAA